MIRIERLTSDHADFQHLIQFLDRELNARYGLVQKQYDSLNVMPFTDTVLVAYQDQIPVGCGCFKFYDPDTVEIKRMFVQSGYRRKGIARMVLSGLEAWAMEKEFIRAILETGKGQPEAIEFYSGFGYALTENFGPYIGNNNSLCMSKELCKSSV